MLSGRRGQLSAIGYWPLALLRVVRFSHWTGAHKMRPYTLLAIRIGQEQIMRSVQSCRGASCVRPLKAQPSQQLIAKS